MKSPWLLQRKIRHAEKQIKKTASEKRKDWWQKKLWQIQKKRADKSLRALED